ncbi:MAG: O-antigen ligase family protein [Candidatus Omnitrophica bacterium]|nr:O-antigen ligase family protein [Candidatus Omnitrophota bacterium]
MSKNYNYDKLGSFVSYIWLLFAGTMVARLFYPQNISLQDNFATGDRFNQIFFGVLIIVNLFIIAKRWAIIKNSALKNWPLLLLVGYAFLSIAWSSYPLVSLRRCLLFFGSIEVAFVIASQEEGVKSFFTIMYYLLLTISIASLFVIILMPHIGIDYQYGGAWKGIFTHKNSFGRQAVIGSLFFLFFLMPTEYRKNNIACVLLFLLNVLFTVKASSATALVAFFIMIILFFSPIFIKNSKMENFWIFIAMLIIVLFCAAKIFEGLFFNESLFKNVVSALGKDTTLTGRTYIWSLMFSIIRQHPILGCGFGGFSLFLQNNLLNSLGWVAMHPHNGYLEVLNELGAVGSVFFYIFFIDTWRRSIRLFRYNYFFGVLCFSVVALVSLYNIVESPLVDTYSILWYIFCFIYVLSAKILNNSDEAN